MNDSMTLAQAAGLVLFMAERLGASVSIGDGVLIISTDDQQVRINLTRALLDASIALSPSISDDSPEGDSEATVAGLRIVLVDGAWAAYHGRVTV